MTLIADTGALAAFCQRQRAAEFVAVDTEFMRDKTYWPQLCLVQIAGPEEAAAIDTLAPGLDLEPLLRADGRSQGAQGVPRRAAGHRDLLPLTGRIPAPLVDTQVAAMVCGFGDAVSYETLAAKLAGARIDKSSRFTDWAHRPLTDRQLHYALSDVTHLRPAYEHLARRLAKTGRTDWVAEEMAVLTEPRHLSPEPREAWRRLKSAATSRAPLAVLREVAAWREEEAQRRDLPRNRMLRDETAAARSPPMRRATSRHLARCRGLSRVHRREPPGGRDPGSREARPGGAGERMPRARRRAATCRRASAR